jgi:NitT/TauT family transport system permease protein
MSKGRYLMPAAGLAAGIVVWHLAVQLFEPGSFLSRFGPVDALPALIDFVGSAIGRGHLVATLRRLLLGLSAAVVVGVTIGSLVGINRTLKATTSWVFQFLRMISPLAWTPLVVAIFGIGDPPVLFLVALAAVWPVMLSVASGIEHVESGWIQVGHSLGATRWELVKSVLLPAIRPHLGTGVRLALGTAWIVIVPAEMLGVDSGLGYAILDARDRFDYPELMGIIIIIGVIGIALDAAVQRATVARLSRERPITRQPRQRVSL